METMVEIEFDMAFEESEESFGEFLERLNKANPEVSVRVLSYRGPAAGWPLVAVVIPESKVDEFGEWYCGDADLWAEMKAEIEACR